MYIKLDEKPNGVKKKLKKIKCEKKKYKMREYIKRSNINPILKFIYLYL